MSWSCPHQRGMNSVCERLKTLCRPLQKGCVLEGKFKGVSRSTDTAPPPLSADRDDRGPVAPVVLKSRGPRLAGSGNATSSQ